MTMKHIAPSRLFTRTLWGLVVVALSVGGCGSDPVAGTQSDTAADAVTDTAADAVTDTAADTAADTTAPVDAALPPTAAYQTLSIGELVGWLAKKDFELINVHVPWGGQIPGTDKHISYTQIGDIEAYLGHDKGAKAVLYCKTGPMSLSAVNKLVKLGYWNLWDFPSGMVGWQASGQQIDYSKP